MKMTCKEALEQLYEYVDNELDDNNYSKIREHLDKCRACCEKFEFEQALKKIVKDKVRIHKVPQDLRDSITKRLLELQEERSRTVTSAHELSQSSAQLMSALSEPEKESKTCLRLPVRRTQTGASHRQVGIFHFFRLRPAYIVAAVLIPLLISGFGAYVVFFKSLDSSPIIKDVAECHERFIRGETPLDLVSSNINEISRYLSNSKQVSFAVSVPVSNGHIIKHLGCKNCNLAGRRSAHIGLERMHNKISLEIMNGSGMNINGLKKELFGGRPYYFGRHKGYNVILWKYGNTLYSLTSKIRRRELIDVAEKAICPYYER